MKGKVEETIPGGVGALESIRGEKIEEFSGYNKLKSEMAEIKVKAYKQIEEEKDSFEN